MCESPKSHDNLNITDAESRVKRRVPEILIKCFTRQLHNKLIASPYCGRLPGARHANKNDLIISDTMICSLAPPQLRPMTDNHKTMRGCAIFNTSKYFQEPLNAWWRKQ